MLVGRDSERAAVAVLLDQARASRGAALVLRGLPGVGKSALIDDAVSIAEGLLVLRTSAIESESPLAFAALQRLLRPAMVLVDRLPPRQATALRPRARRDEHAIRQQAQRAARPIQPLPGPRRRGRPTSTTRSAVKYRGPFETKIFMPNGPWCQLPSRCHGCSGVPTPPVHARPYSGV